VPKGRGQPGHRGGGVGVEDAARPRRRVGLAQRSHGLVGPAVAQVPDPFRLQGLVGRLHVVARQGEGGIQHVRGDGAPGRLGPGVQPAADPPRLEVLLLEGRATYVLGLGSGAPQVPHPVKGEGDVIAGDPLLPPVPCLFQQPDRLAVARQALVVAGGGAEGHAVEVQGLPLPPDVVQVSADGQRPLGVVGAAAVPAQEGHRRGMERVRLGQLRGGRVALGQVQPPQVGPQGRQAAALEPVGVGQPAVQSGGEQVGSPALGGPACEEPPGPGRVQQLHHALPRRPQRRPQPPARHPPPQ
jgi:hypothetical protein